MQASARKAAKRQAFAVLEEEQSLPREVMTQTKIKSGIYIAAPVLTRLKKILYLPIGHMDRDFPTQPLQALSRHHKHTGRFACAKKRKIRDLHQKHVTAAKELTKVSGTLADFIRTTQESETRVSQKINEIKVEYETKLSETQREHEEKMLVAQRNHESEMDETRRQIKALQQQVSVLSELFSEFGTLANTFVEKGLEVVATANEDVEKERDTKRRKIDD